MKRLGRLLSFFFFLGFAYVLLFAFYPPSRLWPVYLIESNDHPQKGADAVLLLMGDIVDRTPEAARLWKEGYAHKIVFVEEEKDQLVRLGLTTSRGQISYNYLTKILDVPEDAILFYHDANVDSTKAEAEKLLGMLEKEHPEMKRLILTTSWYHSRRAAWIFARINGGRWTIESSPTLRLNNWYEEERGFLFVFNEYLKWPYYLLKYGLI